MTRLAQLLEGLAPPAAGWADLDVSRVRDDSREVRPGDLFVALRGLTVDGHQYADRAAAAGAVAVVAERSLAVDAPCIVVPDSALALATIAARLAGRPADEMTLLGITGTNGKTTTTFLMETILAAAGHAPGVIGTVAYRYAGAREQARFTTPTPVVLQGVLGRMRARGCSHVIMEVSSHALELGRVHGCPFSVAAFTHLTQDHLDLHGSMEAYLEAKLRLFRHHLVPGGTAVINLDGHGAGAVVAAVEARGDVALLGVSSQGAPGAGLRLDDVRYSIDGLTGELRVRGAAPVPVASPLIGTFNGDNILMAAGCCHAAGIELERVARAVPRLRGVPGRLERVDGGREFAVLVDYAHTPDALERAVGVLRPICAGRLIVVFGCGGDRDRTKRPLMAGAVGRQADLAVVTSDNPRTEDPLAIIDEVLPGIRAERLPELARLDREAARGYLVEPDRRAAIFAAVRAARAGDVVLVAGKGHEDYQILGTERIHFDDREQAREALGE